MMKNTIKKSIASGMKNIKNRLVYPKLNTIKFGLAGGIVTGICIFLTTLLAINDYCVTCGILLRDIYGTFGYNLNITGALLGLIYGFIDGFIFTWLFAFIYNRLP